MSKKPEAENDEMREEYDFSSGVRGKYIGLVGERPNVVSIDPELAAEFPDSASVNRALREYLASKKGSA